MTSEQQFAHKHDRRLAFWVIFFLIVSLLCIRYFVLPRFDASLTAGSLPLAAKFLEDFSTTIIVTGAMAWLVGIITPRRVKNAGIAVVGPRPLKGDFKTALAKSNSWQFFGGCGRYFRSAVLGEMSTRTRSESMSKRVSAIILNPENDSLCENHAQYRSGTRRGQDDGNWTKVRVKQELLATIVIAKRTADTFKLLDVDIYVSNHFSIFRVDISDIYAIETREDSTAPAIKTDQHTDYYTALREEYRVLQKQSMKIVKGEAECTKVVDLITLRDALAVMGLTQHGLDDSDLTGVLDIIKDPKNPYA